MTDLRQGHYRDTLDGETWDHLITDPPYSPKTHTGHNAGVSTADRLRDQLARMQRRKEAGLPATSGAGRRKHAHNETQMRSEIARAEAKGSQRRPITYAAWTADDVRAFVQWAAPRTRGWMACFCDDVLAPAYVEAMEAAGRYSFAPIVWFSPGSRVRTTGDGPACWVTWIVVSRPRSRDFAGWGALPGGYSGPQDHGRTGAQAHIGGKPEWLMRALVADYSRPGDIICDPCAGWGTTLVAARAEGRRAIGSEMDPETWATASQRISTAQRSLFEIDAIKQPSLFGDNE